METLIRCHILQHRHSILQHNTGLHSAIGNVSDCISRVRELDYGLVPYFHGDWSWNNFYGHSPPFSWYKKGCYHLQVKVCAGCQTVLIQIKPDILSGLICFQTVCKSYQQTTLDKELRDGAIQSILCILMWRQLFFRMAISQTMQMKQRTMWNICTPWTSSLDLLLSVPLWVVSYFLLYVMYLL